MVVDKRPSSYCTVSIGYAVHSVLIKFVAPTQLHLRYLHIPFTIMPAVQVFIPASILYRTLRYGSGRYRTLQHGPVRTQCRYTTLHNKFGTTSYRCPTLPLFRYRYTLPNIPLFTVGSCSNMQRTRVSSSLLCLGSATIHAYCS